MTVQINYKKKIAKNTTSNLVLFTNENFDINIVDQQTLNSFKSMTEILNEVLEVSKPTTLIACQTCEVALQ